MTTHPTIQTPPQSPELEAAVLGAILLEHEVMIELAGHLKPEHFADRVNAAIYRTIADMYELNEPIDLFTVASRCKSIHDLSSARIAPILAEYTQNVGSGANAQKHALLLREYALRRQIIAEANNVMAKAHDTSVDLSETLSLLSRCSDECNGQLVGGRTLSIGEVIDKSIQAAERRCQMHNENKMAGITTGLAELDRMTGGWKPSQLIVLAARPAMGKTATMLHFARAAALSGVPVCIFSLEMADVSLADRLLLSEANIDADRFRAGSLSSGEWSELERAAERLSSLPIYVDDNPIVSMRYIKARSKILQKQGKCGLILVDYLQLADTSTGSKTTNREQEIAKASRSAKIIAKELGVPFILLSQLSRGVEGRSDKMPLLSDLRESGAIEQDADIVSFIYRPAYYKMETIATLSHGTIPTAGLGVLQVAKQRDGATGMVLFEHNPSMTKIADYGRLPSDQCF